MSFLTLDNVSHKILSTKDNTKALDQISMNVKEGEFVSILGPSGCGKSTILSIIAQVIEQTEGSVRLKHRDHHHLEDSIGYMLQQDYLFPWKTIIDNVLLGPKIKQTNTKIGRASCREGREK